MRIVGVGQPVAGDDGVGPAVVARLTKEDLPPEVTLSFVREASALLPMFAEGGRLLVVDAVVAERPPGEVLVLAPHEVADGATSSVSSHGVGVAQALALAQTLAPELALEVTFVGVTIARPSSYRDGFSPEVERAVTLAVRRVVELLEMDVALWG